MTNYMTFDLVCKYDAKSESYYGGIPNLNIEVTDKYSEGEVIDEAIIKALAFFNGVMTKDNGEKVLFDATLASIKLELKMRVIKDQTLDNFSKEEPVPEPKGQVSIDWDLMDKSIAKLDKALAKQEAEEESVSPQEPEHKSYGISMNRYHVAEIIDNGYSIDAIPMPAGGTHVETGDWLYLYEKGEQHGRSAYIAKMMILQMRQVDKIDMTSHEWSSRHGISDWEISKMFANTTRPVSVAIINRSTIEVFDRPVPVPDGEKAPRGINWLPKEYLEKINTACTPSCDTCEGSKPTTGWCDYASEGVVCKEYIRRSD